MIKYWDVVDYRLKHSKPNKNLKEWNDDFIWFRNKWVKCQQKYNLNYNKKGSKVADIKCL